ncbi:MAG: hypothetical protein WCC72_07000 [Dehalococcoidales bacterium]|jgi:hypothetical protein
MKLFIYIILFSLIAALLFPCTGCAGNQNVSIAYVQNIEDGSSTPPQSSGGSGYAIIVSLIPTSAVANVVYKVDLYEKGIFIENATISWDKYEISVHNKAVISFPIGLQDGITYWGKNVSGVYSIKIHQ